MTSLTSLSDSLRFLIIVRSRLGPMGVIALTSADKKHFRLANKLPGPDTLITHLGSAVDFVAKKVERAWDNPCVCLWNCGTMALTR